MRFAIIVAVPIITVALAACSEGGMVDANLKTTLRQSLIASCNATAQGQIPEGISVDVAAVCDCATDKVMAERSISDLVANPPSPGEALGKVRACITEAGPVKIAPVTIAPGE
jgi:hypothetical protein